MPSWVKRQHQRRWRLFSVQTGITLIRGPNSSLVMSLVGLNKANLRLDTATLLEITTSGTISQMLVSFKALLAADKPLSLPNTYFWSANFWTLGEGRSLRVIDQVKKLVQV